METECHTSRLEFHPHQQREVIGKFDGGSITSDAGGLLLREVEQKFGIIRQFTECFTDHRDPEKIEHTVDDLLAQRIFGLALGYEDLSDHDRLRHDPLLALMVGKKDITGQDRVEQKDRGKALAGKSTLNRLELTPAGASESSRYKKIVAHHHKIEDFLLEMSLQLMQMSGEVPDEIVLDFDATDDPIHGNQLGKFFQGYYKCHCYLPLYVFCGEHLLCAKLRTANRDACDGTVEQLMRLVPRIREVFPGIKIILRGDGGFCREPIMKWCEENDVDYLLGLAKNKRLKKIIASEMIAVKLFCKANKEPARLFKSFSYRTLDSWSKERRVVAKAEHLPKGANPRFVVTSLSEEELAAQPLYENHYCARGEMENRIKEQQLYLFADRTSSHTMRANQSRLWFSSIAYMLMMTLRHVGLKNTKMEKAQCHTIREKLLKVGARIRVTVRKVWLSFSESYPYRELFERVLLNIRKTCPLALRV